MDQSPIKCRSAFGREGSKRNGAAMRFAPPWGQVLDDRRCCRHGIVDRRVARATRAAWRGLGRQLWTRTESLGRGDFRFYYLVQFYPLIAIPLLIALCPPRYTRGADLIVALGRYLGPRGRRAVMARCIGPSAS